ncbi:MAG: hypothetical protein R2744_01570 [Bacteroidales bacterium]
MLFWIENAEYRHIVQSAVNVAINNAINNAGITIPFPQHDLHLKTIDRRDYRSVPEIIITSLRIDIGSPGFSLLQPVERTKRNRNKYKILFSY